MSNGFIFNPDKYAETDCLGFDQYIDTLKDMITDPEFKTPFCIGVYGKWGSGKTTFMHLLASGLERCGAEPCVIPVWFNPWRYSKEDHLIIPFLKTIEQTITNYINKNTTLSDTLIQKLKTAAVKIGEVAAAFAYGMKAEFKLLGKYGFELEVAKAVDREEELVRQRLEQAESLSQKLSSIYYDTIAQLKEAVKDSSFRVTIFIDDLDRCLPEKAVELLEAIKIFLDIEGYLVVIGVAKEVVAKGIAYRYRYLDKTDRQKPDESLISPEEYLEKMIQLPLELPPIEPGKKRAYIASLMGGHEEYKQHADIIELGVGDNPRTLKRFINLLAFMSRHAENVKKAINKNSQVPENSLNTYFNPLLYIKWALIVFKFPIIHNQIKGNKHLLLDLQTAATGPETTADQEKLPQLDEKLKTILQKGDGEKDFFPDSDWLIARFVHLTEATEIPTGGTETLKSHYEPHLKTGGMVKIPKGPFLYGENNKEDSIDYDYFISEFPVTNRQYQEFIDANPDYPVPSGSTREWANWDKTERTFPPGMEDHPVVGVSYKDATSYCDWLTNKRNDGHTYRLPSEKEWEKAARGTDGRTYPWGNDFDKNKCNSEESGTGKTSPVGSYPDGVSPYGCQDMAGNVWEWTDSLYGSGVFRVLRGGCWFSSGGYCRSAYRNRVAPGRRDDNGGFRFSCGQEKKEA